MSRETWLYFAYGSNMPRTRIETRLGACVVLAAAVLSRHDLRFHKRGADGSGKCNAYWTGDHRHRVHGVVYRIDAKQRRTLDGIEGAGYENCEVTVHADTEIFEVFTYVARPAAIESTAVPFTWYKSLVTEGAREHELPAHYIAVLDSIPARHDRDCARSELHSALVRGAR